MNYNNKYKERSPLETIKIIQTFFSDKKLQTKFFTEYRDQSLTWYARITLFFNNIKILETNGKGVTENFAIASGFGELYERYCNLMHIGSNNLLLNKILEQHYNQYGYYLDKKEKNISIKEACQYEQNQFIYYENAPGQLESILKIIYNNNFIGVPYVNIINQNKKFLDPRIIKFFKGSSGMSAGNSFEEAFNQGFSELLEHHWGGLYLTDPFQEYYSIDLQNIKNENIKKSIISIQKAGHKLYIYDMSYQLKMPVLMGVLICKNNRIHVNISSFPVFDIAIERIITELYQGNYILLDNLQYRKQLPYKNYSINYIEGSCTTSITGKQSFPESIFFKTKKVNVNYNIFLSNTQVDNIQIFKYYQNLIQKNQLQIYYRNVSQSQDMYALHIYALNLSGLSYAKMLTLINNKYDICYKYIYDYIYYFQNLINNNEYNINILKTISSQWLNFTPYEQSFINAFLPIDYFSLYQEKHQKGLYSIYILYNLLNLQGEQQLLELCYQNNYNELSKYFLLYDYCKSGKYTIMEIKNIMKNIYNLYFTEEDYQNITENNFLCKKLFLIPLINFYKNNDNQYIKILAEY